METHERNHVLPVLVEGEPSSSNPLPLKLDKEGESELYAVDLRSSSLLTRLRKLRTEKRRLLAPCSTVVSMTFGNAEKSEEIEGQRCLYRV